MSEALPPGTDSFQLEVAPSGHIVLPSCEFSEQEQEAKHSLTLLARQKQSTGERGDPETSAQPSSSSGHIVPSPPVHEPRLPYAAYRDHEPRFPAPTGPPSARL